VEQLDVEALLFSERVPEGSDLVSDWNKRYPKWLYGPNTKNFWRDYKNVWRAIDEPVSREEQR